MPAARLFVAKTAGDIARSTGFTRFSESARPSYDRSGGSSYAKRRSARAAAARRGGDESLTTDTTTTTCCAAASMHEFDGGSTTMTRSREEAEMEMNNDHYSDDLEMQRPDNASNMELVEVESRDVYPKSMG